MEYLKTDAEIMQALFVDKHDVDECYLSGLKKGILTLIDGNVCYKGGERTCIAALSFKYAIHVEPKWYDKLSPEMPVLAKGNITGRYYALAGVGDDGISGLTKGGPSLADPMLSCLTPLTRKEIQVFMDNAPE